MSFAKALRCRECGREYPIAPSHVCEFCFGPLEVVYDYDGIKSKISRESIARGPASMWRYARPAALRGRAGRPAGRLHAPDPRQEPRQAPRPQQPLHQERLRQPDLVLQGPRRRRRLDQGARVRLQDPRLRLHRQPGQRRLRPRRPRRHGGLRLRAERPRGRQAARLQDLRRQPRRRRRLLRRRQPSLRRAGRQVQLGLRQHQHPPLLLRGLQDAGLRSRRAARLARPGPLHRADGLRLALRQDLEGPARVREPWPDRRRQDADVRRQATGCSPIITAYENKHAELPAGAAEHDRQVAGHRQPGGRLLHAEDHAGIGRRRRRRQRRRGRRRASGCWPRPRASSPRPRVASRSPASSSSSHPAKCDPDETVVAFITGGGLKTQEAVEGVLPPAIAVKPTVASFEEALLAAKGAIKAELKA